MQVFEDILEFHDLHSQYRNQWNTYLEELDDYLSQKGFGKVKPTP